MPRLALYRQIRCQRHSEGWSGRKVGRRPADATCCHQFDYAVLHSFVFEIMAILGAQPSMW